MGQAGAEKSNTARNIFVGRERELAELVSACDAGADGDARLFLIHGEPGIGKTRLADELASRAKARGIQVLWGRCWEGEGAPAYWPWIQVIRGFLGALDTERRRTLALESQDAAGIMHQVAQIVPDLRPAQSIARPSISDKLGPNEARFRLFDAVTNFLKTGARPHPMLVVLDDLHDADEASLALLHFMARELRGVPILLVGTYREIEVQRSPSLSKLVGELSREARSIPVGGLSESEVKRLVEFRAGQTPDDALVAKLCSATNGNPLFVDGIVRTLLADGAIDSAGAGDRPFKIPSGVREAIRGRLERLSPEANALLAVAAAIGNEFEFNLCQGVADVPADEARRLLDEASSAGVVTALGHGRYRFSHALIRGVVYDDLDTNNRIRIHGTIANRLEESYRENIDPHLAELAHHFREAGVTEKAIEYSIRAGEAAYEVYAGASSISHWKVAFSLMERHGWDARLRADLAEKVAGAGFHVDRELAVEYGQAAIALYESSGQPEGAARAHVRLGQIFHMRNDPLFSADLASDHLRRAESLMASKPETVDRVFLYHIVASNECHNLNVCATERAASQSMEVGERLGDKHDWKGAAAFYAWSLCMRGRIAEASALLDRAFEIAVQAHAPAFAVSWVAGYLGVWLGDPRDARSWYEREFKRTSMALAPLPYQAIASWIDDASFFLGQVRELQQTSGPKHWALRFWVDGEWETIAAEWQARLEKRDRTGDRINAFFDSQLAGNAYAVYLGDLVRGEACLSYYLARHNEGLVVPWEMIARPALANVYVAMDRVDDAAAQVARCREIMASGEDWRGRVGDVARAEGVIAAARNNYDLAFRQFESALAIHRKYHLAAEEAETLRYWGRALAAAGDRSGAAEKFDTAIEVNRARGVGLRFIEFVQADKARALSSAPTGTDNGALRESNSAKSKLIGTFRREGEFWTIAFGGATFRLKNAKGLHYIAYLIARPGQRFHVHDLIEAIEGSAAHGKSTLHADSEGLEIVRDIDGPAPTIDARARSEYRARLRDLQIDLDEAERMNDLGRCESLRREIEIVGEQLTGSSGLGGHARTVSASAERARGMVGKNIRSALDKIRDEHPALGRHFAATISTGYFCSYQPDPDRPISWQL